MTGGGKTLEEYENIVGYDRLSKSLYETRNLLYRSLANSMSYIIKKKGTAFTSNFKFNLGEIFNIDLDFKSEEADFHRLEQRLGSGDHSINYSVNLGFSPHELLKENYFQLPLNIKYSKGLYSPQYKPGSDIILGGFNQTPNELKNINNSVTLSTSLNTMLSLSLIHI